MRARASNSPLLRAVSCVPTRCAIPDGADHAQWQIHSRFDAGATATRLTAVQSQSSLNARRRTSSRETKATSSTQQLHREPWRPQPRGDSGRAIASGEYLGETEETRRLLYVAPTRAKEAIICAIAGKATKDEFDRPAKSVWGKCGVRPMRGRQASSRACLFSISAASLLRALSVSIRCRVGRTLRFEVVGAEDNDGAANQEEGCSLQAGPAPRVKPSRFRSLALL